MRFYRVYLHKVPGALNRTEVEQKIAELQKLLEQQKKTQAMPPDQVKPPAGAGEAPSPAPEPSGAPPIATPPIAAPEPPPVSTPIVPARAHDLHAGRGKKIAGVMLIAVGVAALAAGAACLALARQNGDALTALDRGMQTWARRRTSPAARFSASARWRRSRARS